MGISFFKRHTRLRSRALDFHYSIEKRCGQLARFVSFYCKFEFLRNLFGGYRLIVEKINFSLVSLRFYVLNVIMNWSLMNRSIRTNMLNSSELMSCGPAKIDIVFHKTHKCSSSSIQNFLMRYAKKHELTLVLPKVLILALKPTCITVFIAL